VPGMFSSKIDNGMKSGIPDEVWPLVITIYDDAEQVQKFTGTENKMPARVLVLDQEGQVIYFHDRGFSPIHLKQLTNVLSEFESSPTPISR
jgi:hypothetical protein